MEYYSLLTVVYELMGHTWEFSIWFPSEDKCWSVLTEVNTIYDRVKATEGYCQVTEVASKIVKPMVRPW